jgi:hypothetical protein
LAIVAVTALFAVGAMPAAAAGATDGAVSTGQQPELTIKGYKLTPAQAQALKQAHAKNPKLTVAQAQQVVDNSSPIKPASSGSDSSAGNCSRISLWGNSNGNYRFSQTVYAQAGQAAFGLISISTDGLFASERDYDPVGWYQGYTGKLQHTGFWPSETTMNGWMVTANDWWCWGALRAIWH